VGRRWVRWLANERVQSYACARPSGAPAKSAPLSELNANGVSSTKGGQPRAGRLRREAFQVVAGEQAGTTALTLPMAPIAGREGGQLLV
jgi:hypothetical protein